MAGKKGTAVARRGVSAPAVRRAAVEVGTQMEAGEGLGMEMMLPNGQLINMKGNTFDQTASQGFQGDAFIRLLNANGDTGVLRTAAVLRENEWREYDKIVTQIARGKFTLVADMMANNMRAKLENPMGTTQIVWDRAGDMADAQIDMTGEATDIRDRIEFAQDSMPVPIIHHGFRLNIRTLMASRARGQGIDISHAQLATLKVVHTIEKLHLFGQFTAGAGAGSLYGLTKYPYRVTGALSADWRTATAAQIFSDVNAMVSAMELKNQFGPYMLYVPTSYAQVLRRDYNAGAGALAAVGHSIRSRLLEIENLKDIKTNWFMPDNHIVLINLNPENLRTLDGIQPRMIEWNTQGGMVSIFKIIAIMLPQIKRDAADQCGIVHFSI
jgi:hypothetical protein